MKSKLWNVIIATLCLAMVTACNAQSEPSPDAAQDFDPTALWQHVRDDFELFYAYLDQRDFDADLYLDRVESLVSEAQSLDTFRNTLNRATYAFTDPHLGFGPYTDADFNIIPTSSDLQINHHSERYVVIDVRAKSAAYEAGIRPDWVLTHASGEPIEPQISAIFKDLVDSPSDAQLDYAATLLANGRRTGERRLTFLDSAGLTQDISLPNPRELAREVMASEPVDIEWIVGANGTRHAWVRINNRLGDNDLIQQFDDVMTDIQFADGLILDLRNTPSGGNAEVGRSIMGHFVTEPRPFQMHERPSLEREFSVPRRYVEYVLPRDPAFDPDKTVVLGGYWTGSMGEGIVIGMDAIGVHTIASDMGDLLGGMSQFSFADGAISLSIPTETLFHIDGTPREDFTAKTGLISSDTDESGQDPALAEAIALLNRL